MINDKLKRQLDNLVLWGGIGPDTEKELEEVFMLASLVPKELKHKKDIPTVIEYQGRRYVLDYGTRN